MNRPFRAPSLSRHPPLRLIRLAVKQVAVCSAWLLLSATAQAGTPLQYNRDVRPILAEHCFNCHGPDSASRKADLRLDQREAAIELGAITPGDPANSELLRRVNSHDPDEIMPPAETKKSLTDAQKKTLAEWILQGAEYQPHWSLIAPIRPPVPQPQDRSWVRNPIDAFILEGLRAAHLSPAPEADKSTLLRRVCLDLTGLPPTPEMTQSFLNDSAPDAYEKIVDQLLASPAWGEHRGRYWLDYARYADTHGVHFDNYREMWSYRDWVIQAFNSNMPYDQFTIENLAGDLLPNSSLEQQIGSGFNRCNITTNEGGIIDEEYLVLYTRDRVETTSQIWLGLTAGCAVCHTHKFDPLTQREFYELAAYFNNTTQKAKDGNIPNTPPVIVVPEPADRMTWKELNRSAAELDARIAQRREATAEQFQQWLATATPGAVTDNLPQAGLELLAPLTDTSSSALVRNQEVPMEFDAGSKWQADRSGHVQTYLVSKADSPEFSDAGDFEFDQPFTISAWVKLPAKGKGTIVGRMQGSTGWELFATNLGVGLRISHSDMESLSNTPRRRVEADKWTHVILSYDGSGKSGGLAAYFNGEPADFRPNFGTVSHSIRNNAPLRIGRNERDSSLEGLGLQDLRIYNRLLAPYEIEALGASDKLSAIIAKPAERRTPQETDRLQNWWLPTLDDSARQLAADRREIQREQDIIAQRGTIAHVMNEKPEMPTAHILNRGEYDQRTEQVTAKTPAMLPPLPAEFPNNRLGFAQWLLLPEHPLTARVTVNRFWQEVFGTGLVKTAGDFGVMGELPSHPELLDWLAVEFREQGWDVKQLFRMFVTSATYRQSAVATPEKIEADPSNRLLSRGPRFRMDAEMVRDYALAASGELVAKIGGPSVRPYQPPGIWEAIAMKGSNTGNYKQGTGDELYRRSLYTFVKRMAPPASLELFNSPNREVCTVRRERTNTPLQALVTLNDEQFVEAARQLAQRAILEGGPDTGKRLQVISLRLLARDFSTREVAVIESSLAGLVAYYNEHPEEAGQVIAYGESKADPQLSAPELAAWTMLCNQLMNLDEVLNK
ncbi:DUF1553 domain-containing protein [Planctomicrobium sp. SH664]|uniref:DUF1553 domain-containing protein n=1 Tax=Planctomicrobium sp. SH664 TaxID=3448125 RepID=UPI003F5BE421